MDLLTELSDRMGKEVNRRHILRALTKGSLVSLGAALPMGFLASKGVVEAQAEGSYTHVTGIHAIANHCCPLYDCHVYQCNGCPGGNDKYKCTDICTGEVIFECNSSCRPCLSTCHYSYC